MQYHQGLINLTRLDNGYTPLHLATEEDCYDALCLLAAIVRMMILIVWSLMCHCT